MKIFNNIKNKAPKVDLKKGSDEISKNIKKIDKRRKQISFSISPGPLNFLVTVLFAVFIIFSNSDYGFRSKIKYMREMNDGQQRLDYLKKEMSQDSLTVEQLRTNDHFLEEYVRHNLNMIGRDEEAFIVREQ